MQSYKVTYNGNSTKFQNFQTEIDSKTPIDAVIEVYSKALPENYFPEYSITDPETIERVYDCDGECISNWSSNLESSIYYDGGYFTAELITGE